MDLGNPLYFITLWFFLLMIAASTALMEIQIEGANGWAKFLPTWRASPAWLKRFLNGKEITGYHLHLNIHLYLLFHLPLLFSGWSWMAEFTILSLLFAFMAFEDFLWFIFNPHFSWSSFHIKKIPWYTKWWGPFPVEYYVWLTISCFFACLRGYTPEVIDEPLLEGFTLPAQQGMGWAMGFLLCCMMIAIVIASLAPGMKKFLKEDTKPHPGHPGVNMTYGIPTVLPMVGRKKKVLKKVLPITKKSRAKKPVRSKTKKK